jgi:glycosyltransferase involved in cell wall biosynthesis
MQSKKVIWYGPPYSYSGYAQHNRAMLFELNKLGWDIDLRPTETDIPKGLIGKEILLGMIKNNRHDPANTICLNLVPPPALPLFSCYTILFTTIESDTIHPGFMLRIKQYDEVWVPCMDNYVSLVRAGFPSSKLRIVKEGVYTDFFTPHSPPLPDYKSDLFTFFFHGDWSYRKGIDILLRSYCQAFKTTDNVRLLMLTHYQGTDTEHSAKRITEELKYLLQKFNIKNVPKIDFIFDYIPDSDLSSLYNCTDVYVCPSRGEAWCLPVCQSMSCGRPSIITGWGGQTDFCNSKNGYVCKVDKFDIIDNKCSLSVDFYKGQKFAFCDVNHFSRLMRHCYENQEEVKEKGKKARKDIYKNFDWKFAGQIANRRLRSIYESSAYNANLQSFRSNESLFADVISGYVKKFV